MEDKTIQICFPVGYFWPLELCCVVIEQQLQYDSNFSKVLYCISFNLSSSPVFPYTYLPLSLPVNFVP